MGSAVNPRRTYDSTRRRAQAAQTRQDILTAAGRLFVEQGYGRTTVEAIATDATVAPETVYAAFGSKRAILRQLLDVAAVGDEEASPLRERPWLRALADEPDQQARLRLVVHHARKVMDRSTDLLMVLRHAADADPRLEAEWSEVNRLMLQDHAAFVAALAGANGLRDGLTADASTDILWTLLSPEVYQRLVRWRGWTPERYERWIRDTVRRTLLD